MVCIAVAALSWYNICIVLQIDQRRYFITVLTVFIHYMSELHDNRHIIDPIVSNTCTCWILFIDRIDIHINININRHYMDI